MKRRYSTTFVTGDPVRATGGSLTFQIEIKGDLVTEIACIDDFAPTGSDSYISAEGRWTRAEVAEQLIALANKIDGSKR